MVVLSERAAIRRLHDRLAFGARPGELDRSVVRGFDSVAAALLTGPGGSPDAVSSPPPELPPVPAVEVDDPRRPAADRMKEDQQRLLRLWWLDRMTAAEDPCAEKLTWFWHGHFATSEAKVDYPDLVLAQNETLRAHVRGDFRAMTRAMVVDAALVYWLDGQANLVGAANENLGRELMELFTLGLGHYGETDVKEASRALTGWTIDPDLRVTEFDPGRWDPGAKTVLGRTGELDAVGLVDVLVARPESADFVIGRLWARLVSSTPPSAGTRDVLRRAYGPATDLRALLAAIVGAPEFRDGASVLVKQPVEWAIGLMRAVGVRAVALTDDEADHLVIALQSLGQLPFRPPSVGGWPDGIAWLTPSANLDRLTVARLVLSRADLRPPTSGRLDWARDVLGVETWSARTATALDRLDEPRELLAVAAISPEYVVSG
ncbi:DUF1800 domain-containing protein [Actinomycetospora flava]|uniref:DUF1800 domain-containing protein n=1 Tax=Actinomycetospora flava TaxID=3129232 RepID=A0ABU8M6H3_9PSEU